jgi:hypothetical protein
MICPDEFALYTFKALSPGKMSPRSTNPSAGVQRNAC